MHRGCTSVYMSARFCLASLTAPRSPLVHCPSLDHATSCPLFGCDIWRYVSGLRLQHDPPRHVLRSAMLLLHSYVLAALNHSQIADRPSQIIGIHAGCEFLYVARQLSAHTLILTDFFKKVAIVFICHTIPTGMIARSSALTVFLLTSHSSPSRRHQCTVTWSQISSTFSAPLSRRSLLMLIQQYGSSG
jgi:hypothetical protein